VNFDRVERLLGSENLERLAKSRVCVVGLGSGGGFVALNLAMSGVENFILVDDDALEETNLTRHVADRRYLGWNKAAAVADLIRNRNPQAQVEVREGLIELHMDVLDHCDLLIVGVDGEGTKYTLNEACLERNLPAVYAGVYERGEGGDVVVIHPYNGPCYACWAAELREGLQQATEGEALDYGMVNERGTIAAEPGLWTHVVKVAAVQTDFALNELLSGSTARPAYPANTLIIANNAMEIIEDQPSPPHSTIWANIPRDPYCLVCGDQLQQNRQEDETPFSLDDLAGDSGIMIEDDEHSTADSQRGTP
jgi:molybdopterin/thiamine biosynthesis adenylyltransferase